MRNLYQTFYNFLFPKPYLLQVAIFYLLTFAIAVVSLPLQFAAFEIAGEKDQGPTHINDIFSGVIIVPIIETLVFQLLVFKILEKSKMGKYKYGG